MLRHAGPDLGPEPELASRHLNETEQSSSEQESLKSTGFRELSRQLYIIEIALEPG